MHTNSFSNSYATEAAGPLLARLFDSLTAAGGHVQLCRQLGRLGIEERPLDFDEASRVVAALAALPWFDELTLEEQRDMVLQACAAASRGPNYDESRALLETWARQAHVNAKWRRLEVLRRTGVLACPEST